MGKDTSNAVHRAPDWRLWRQMFEERADRPLPALPADRADPQLPASLARSLAVFQLGESGGGTVIDQARRSQLPFTDENYVAALQLFVREEHRHANLLAMCVRQLGGKLIRANWTARLFVAGRRLIGLRLKIAVLLAAEIVGICFYDAIAGRLPASPMRRWLHEMVADERSHLDFHCCFLNSQLRTHWQRRVFTVGWRCLMTAAAAVVLIDHRRCIRDLGLDTRQMWQRWWAVALMAERLATEKPQRQPAARPIRA